MLWCVCFMSFRNYLYRPVSLQVVTALWREVFMSEGHSEVVLWFLYFCVQLQKQESCAGSIYINIYVFFFLLSVLEWGSAFVFEVHTSSPVSVCVSVFSCVKFFPSCPPCGPKAHRNPTRYSSCECFSFNILNHPSVQRCVFFSFIWTHFQPSIHLHARGNQLLDGAQALLYLSFFH